MKIASFSSSSTIALLSLMINRSTAATVVVPTDTDVPTAPYECVADHSALESEQEIEVQVVSAHPDDNGYWTVNFLSGTFKGTNDVTTWCIDAERVIGEKTYFMDTFSSLDDPTNFEEEYANGVVDKPENLPSLNYLINNYPVGTTITQCADEPSVSSADFQAAAWTVIDATPYPNLLIEGEDGCVVGHLVGIAENNTEYEPDCENPNELIGLILIVDDDVTRNITKQVLISEIPLVCVCSETPTPFPTLNQGGGGKEEPTSSPTPSPTQNGGVNGDPHFKTWSGEKYDFHGVCDLVLLHNPNFRDGIGMDIHVRSKLWKQWSYVSTAVIRIGVETFEVSGLHDGDTYWLNGINGENTHNNKGNEKEELSIAGYPIEYRKVHAYVKEYVIKLRTEESIVIKTWKDFVRVDFVGAAREEDFKGSYGLMGAFPTGNKIGRDLITEVENVNEFGQEWQVGHKAAGRISDHDTIYPDPQLFHNIEGPQFPSRCILPTKTALRRRLAKSEVSREQAEIACSRIVDQNELDLCVFDVIVTDDQDSANAY